MALILHNPLTEADLQAVVDLVSETDHYHYRSLVKVKNVLTRYANHSTDVICIPKWAVDRSDDYAIYYAIHELAHLVYGGGGHSTKYKRVEDRLLKHWEMAIRRMKVYPRTIYSKGMIVYSASP